MLKRWSNAIHVLVLFGFAVAQPLFDLLSRNANFFVARGSRPEDVFSFVCFVSFLLPLLIVGFMQLVSYINRRAYKILYGIVLFLLAAAFCIQVLGRMAIEGPILILTSAAFGILFSIAYFNLRLLKLFMTVLSPSVLIFPALFVLSSGVLKVVSPKVPVSTATIHLKNAPPVIMIVFDEFPLTALLDGELQIDRGRFPNFFRLAESSYWFRNTTSLAAQTLLVLPSIVTGNYPNPKLQPTADDHPHSLFTLLGGVYHIRAFEPKSQLCPRELCETGISRGNFRERLKSLAVDLSVVYAHLMLPGSLGKGLPVITQDWGDFVGGSESLNLLGSRRPTINGGHDRKGGRRRDRSAQFIDFLDSLPSAKQPALNFMHIMLPHRKWEYLPSGKRYGGFSKSDVWDFIPAGKKRGARIIQGTGIGERAAEIWGKDEWVAQQAYQAFLLQCCYVDKLIGELIDRLKKSNLYEPSLIIVTADHGMCFRPNDYTRIVTESNSGDIISVPLFIKKPYQKGHVVIDKKVESADIFPTIAEMLGIGLPWKIDGHSALSDGFSTSDKVRFLNHDGSLDVPLMAVWQANKTTLKWKLDHFSSRTDTRNLYKIGNYREIIGKKSEAIHGEGHVPGVEIDQSSLFLNIDPKAEFIPCQISGRIIANSVTPVAYDIAVSVNGVVEAVTRTFPARNGRAEWSAVVPEDAFIPGRNNVEIFTVRREGGKVALSPTWDSSRVEYRLLGNKGKEKIASSEGETYPVTPSSLPAFLDIAEVRGKYLYFAGWSGDRIRPEIAKAIVVFIDGTYAYAGRCNAERPDLGKGFKNPLLKEAGFKFSLPLSLFENPDHAEVRLFAISKDGKATEFTYPKGYEWGKAVGKSPKGHGA